MNKFQLYTLTGKILALDQLPGQRDQVIREIREENIQWEKLVSIADHHLVLQAIYPKIRDHKLEEYFPEVILEHLKYIFDLTTSRNLDVIKQVENLTAVLSKEGITPLYMKGVGNILDGLYKYPGERILHDIDFLVPEEKLLEAAEILQKDGYQSNYKWKPEFMKQNRHYPILFKPGEPVYAELHWKAVNKIHEKDFTSELIFRNAKKPAKYPECLVMSDEHKIIHNFMHAEVASHSRIYAREFMRNLYDMFLLSERKDPEVVLADFGHYRRTAAGYLDITYDAFGVIPSKRILPKAFLHTFKYRYRLNLRSRFFGSLSLFVLRIFMGYILNPFKAITNKELRTQLITKIKDPKWYGKQFAYYKRVLGIKG